MESRNTAHTFDRIMLWLLPAIAALTPLMVFTLLLPDVGQAYFFQFVTLGALGALGLAWALGWREIPRGWPTLPAWLILLLGLTVAGSLWASPMPLFSIKKLLLPLAGVAYFMLIVTSPERRRLLGRLRVVILIVSALLAIYGTLQHFGFEFLPYSEQVQKNRVMATIGHPNYLASVLGPAVFLIFSLLLASRGRGRKLLAGLAIYAILVCIMLARTRGVWLGLLLGLAGGVALGIHYSLRQRLGLRWIGRFGAGLALLALALAGCFFFVLPAFHAKVNLEERLTSQNEIKSRLYYWRAAIDMGMRKPVFGQGYGRFDPQFWSYTLDLQKSGEGAFYYDMLPGISSRTPGHVHNEYLEVLAEQGFTGLVALLALFGFFLYFGYLRLIDPADPARAWQSIAVYGALITTMTDALFAFPWRLPVSLIVLAVVLAWLYDEIYPQTEGAPADHELAPALPPVMTQTVRA